MSAIGGIGGSGLSQYLLALQASQNNQTAGAQGAANSIPTSALAALAGSGGSSHAHGRHKSESNSIAGTGIGTTPAIRAHPAASECGSQFPAIIAVESDYGFQLGRAKRHRQCF